MITKRITALTRLVSQFDDAFILGFTEEQKQKYLDTLDIKELGSFEDLKVQPTIFVVKPLQSDYEHLIYSDSVNPWLIFATHIESLENCEDIKLTFDKHEVLNECHHDEIPPRVVQDIAHMVISIANQTGTSVFFTQSVASLRYTQVVIQQDAQRQRVALASLAGVKSKDSAQEQTTQ